MLGNRQPPVPVHESSCRPEREQLLGRVKYDGGRSFLRNCIKNKLNDVFAAPDTGLHEPTIAGPSVVFDLKLDVSARATAERLVSFALRLLGVYRGRHPAPTEAEIRTSSEFQIRQGIKEGFDRARRVLSELGVLEGTVATNVDETWHQIQKRLDEVFDPAATAGEARFDS